MDTRPKLPHKVLLSKFSRIDCFREIKLSEIALKDIRQVILSEIHPYLSGAGTGLPTEAKIKKDAKKLKDVIERVLSKNDLSHVYICDKAGLPSYALQNLKSACREICSEDAHKRKDFRRISILFKLDVIFRNYAGDPVNKKADFNQFCFTCFQQINPHYSGETINSLLKEYFKDSSNTEKASVAARMILRKRKLGKKTD